MKTDGNEPIIPVIVDGHGDTGLTKREYFAAMAMQGMMAVQSSFNWTMPHPNLATQCVNMADALIAELNKEQKP